MIQQYLMGLGLPCLPVAPEFPATQYPSSSDPTKPKFSGKNPSYLDPRNRPVIVDHRLYGDRLPLPNESNQWFRSASTGYGTKPGFKVGENYLLIIDLDAKHFPDEYELDAAYFGILDACQDLEHTRIERTRSGGYHIWAMSPVKPGFVNFTLTPDGPHVGEILGGKDKPGFCVIAPTAGYTLIQDADPVLVTDWSFLHPVGGARGETIPAPLPTPAPRIEGIPDVSEFFGPTAAGLYSSPTPPDDRSAAIALVLQECQGWINWLDSNGIRYNGSLTEVAYHLAQQWERLGKIDRILKTIPADATPAAVHRGGDDAAWLKARRITPAQCPPKPAREGAKVVALNRRLPNTIAKRAENEPPPVMDEPPPPPETDEPETSHHNALTSLLSVLDEYFPDIYWDEFAGEPRIPGRSGEELEPGQIRIELATSRGLKAHKEDIQDAITYLARRNPKNPIKEYLEQCFQQHGAGGEIHTIASRYFNAGGIYDVFMRKTLVAAVARAMSPGCKQETITVLQDQRQGVGKTEFWRSLTPAGYFDNSLRFDTSRKYEDIVSQFHRNWITEWGEIDSVFRKRESSFIKGFLSTQVDTIRRPYARNPVTLPRPCIFVGSTNQSDFLQDATGERRYWVIPLQSDRVPVENLDTERDQLWAAAYAIYTDWVNRGRPRAECPYWLTQDEERDAAAIAAEFSRVDPWAEMIEEYIHGREQITISAILSQCLKIEPGRQSGYDASRAGDILKRLGWYSRRIRSHDGRRPTVWFPPSGSGVDQGWIRGLETPPDPPLSVDASGFQPTGSPGSPDFAQNFSEQNSHSHMGGDSDQKSFDGFGVIQVIQKPETEPPSGLSLDQGGGDPPLIHPRSTPDPESYQVGDDVAIRIDWLRFNARLIQRIHGGWVVKAHDSKPLKSAGLCDLSGQLSILDKSIESRLVKI